METRSDWREGCYLNQRINEYNAEMCDNSYTFPYIIEVLHHCIMKKRRVHFSSVSK